MNYNTITTQLTKKIAASALALSIAISGGALIAPPKAEAATATASSKANSIINAAKAQMGTTYKFGASTSTTRYFDCSSLMKYAYKKAGINLPRTSKEQSRVGSYVSKSNLKPGDLVFFYSPVTHVGMYIGNGKIIHTYGKPGVTTDTINSGWWKNNYNTARRVL